MDSLKATSTFDETSARPASQVSSPEIQDISSRAPWVRRTQGRWSWLIHPQWTAVFDQPEQPDWLGLERDPRAVLVKSNGGRQVWHLRLEVGEVFVKVSWPPRSWARLGRWLRGSSAMREWRVANYALEQGVRTVTPVAVAEAPVAGREQVGILVTAAVEDSRPLSEWWLALDPRDPDTRRVKNGLIDAAARLIAQAHQHGMQHFDLHAGNVLIQPRGQGFSALFVDLPSFRVGRAVSDAGVLRNLAQFNQYFQLRGSMADRLRFCDRYLHWREVAQAGSVYGRQLGCDRAALLAQLRVAIDRHARSLYAQRDRRTLRAGRYFTPLRLAQGRRGFAYLAAKHDWVGSRLAGQTLTAKLWKNWLETPGRVDLPADRSRVIKDSPTAGIWRDQLDLPDGSSVNVVCKRYGHRHLWKAVVHALGRSRAMSTWQRGNALLNRMIPTARPLAVIERRRAGLLIDSLVVTEFVEDALDLDTVLTVKLRELEPGHQRTVKDRIIVELSRLLRRLHERGFSHRDLKAPNVMVAWDAEALEPRSVVLVDLDGLRRRRNVSASAELGALARLNVSLDHCKRVTLTDRVRFLKHYLRRAGRTEDAWREAWQKIAELSATKRQVRGRQQQKMLRKYGRF